MNQTQIKYVKARAETIYSDKIKALRAEHTKETITLSTAEAIEAIVSGDFEITQEPYGAKYNPQWWQYVLFYKEQRGGIDLEAFNVAKEALDKEYTKLLDEIVLGDNTEALALLKAFEGV